MSKKRTYTSEMIEISYDPVRCIHAKECVKGLPAVFDPDRRPWIAPGEAASDQVADVIKRCPTGALHFTRLDGGEREPVPCNSLAVGENGPLYITGDVIVRNEDGTEVVRDTRIALCRCGASKHKPFCDGEHTEAGFVAPGIEPTAVEQRLNDETELVITLAGNGPLLVKGQCAGDPPAKDGDALCRCGASENKPFCDGSHIRVGFKG